MKDILIVYYSKNDSTKKMARTIARGIESTGSINAKIRTVNSKHYSDTDDAIVTKKDLKRLCGNDYREAQLILGIWLHH